MPTGTSPNAWSTDEAPADRRATRLILVVVLAGAAGLRFLNLYWGLADGIWFLDEQLMWGPRMAAFRSLGWTSFGCPDFTYPTLYGYLGGLSAWMVSGFGWPVLRSAPDMLAWLRTVSALAGCCTVVVIARTGTSMYGSRVGVAAAAFIAVAPLEVMQTHYASVDPLLVLLTTVVLAASWRIVERGTAGAAALAGLALGLAAATKYTGVLVGTAIAWAVGERAWRDRSVRTFVVLGAVALVAFAVSFVAACPPCLIHLDAVLAILSFFRTYGTSCIASNNCVTPNIGWWGHRWLEYIVAILPYGLGLPLALLAFAGVGVAVARRTVADRIVLAMLLPYFIYTGYFSVAFPRYTLPLFPALALLAAAALGRVGRARMMAVVAGIVVAYGAALSASQVGRYTWQQQEEVAAWLDGQRTRLRPSEQHVAIPGYTQTDFSFRLRGPMRAHGFAVTVQRPGQWLDGNPAFFVLPEWQRIAIRRDRGDVRLMRALDSLESGASGYSPVLRIPVPPYLQKPLDERLDPAFAIDLWQGALGFTVYARADVVPRLGLAK
jgi:4-amino-4-deoxy-L-arabinose transferase-like glycosyltransferase